MRNSSSWRAGISGGIFGSIIVPLFPVASYAQTVINLTNLDPSVLAVGASAALNGSTNIDVVNAAIASSTGGLFSAAASNQTQAGTNQTNVIGLNQDGSPRAVTLSGQTSGTISINTIAAALGAGNYTSTADGPNLTPTVTGPLAYTSQTVANTNAAGAYGANGRALLDQVALGNSLATGSQAGVNNLNGVAVAVPDGTSTTLSQLGAGVPVTSGAYGPGSGINQSVVNTMMAYTGQGSALVLGTPGGQTASNSFNTASIIGGASVAVSQDASGLTDIPNSGWRTISSAPVGTAIQSVNRALAYNAQGGFASPAVNVGVSALGQSSTATMNSLSLTGVGGSGGEVNLSGTQVAGAYLPSTPAMSQMPVGSNPGQTPYAITVNSATATSQPVQGFQGGVGEWAGYAGSLGLSIPEPGSATTQANLPRQATNVSVSEVGQSIGLGYNASSVTNQNVAFGSGGFSQTIGQLSVAGSKNDLAMTASMPASAAGAGSPVASWLPAGISSTNLPLGFSGFTALNSASAATTIGNARIEQVTQTYNLGGNRFSGSSNVSGTLTQSMGQAELAAAEIMSGAQLLCTSPGSCTTGTNGSLGGYYGTSAYGGPSILEGLNPLTTASATDAPNTVAAGPYQVVSQRYVPSAFSPNGAYAGVSVAGNVTVDKVTQTTAVGLNTLSAGGTVSSGSAGQVPGSGVQTISAVTNNGVAANTNYAQNLQMSINDVAAGGAVLGAVAQQAPVLSGSGVSNPSNISSAGSFNNGNAALSGSQVNRMAMNSISAGGTIGSSALPAAVVQTTPYSVDPQYSQTNAFQQTAPANIAVVSVEGGAMGNAYSANVSQVATNSGNTLSGESATGNVSQLSTGIASTLQNASFALALRGTAAPAPPNRALGTGNAMQIGSSQATSQVVNTMVLGAAQGTLNQTLSQQTALASGNAQAAASLHGVAIATGAQVAVNSANNISAR